MVSCTHYIKGYVFYVICICRKIYFVLIALQLQLQLIKLSIIFQCYCQYAPYCAIQIQMTHWYQRQPGYTKPTGRSIMNWHVNGRASMPCDAPIFIDFNIQSPPRNSPSLLPLMHQHRLKLAMARILLNLSQYSGPRNPQANVIDLNFSRFSKSADS